MSESARRIMRVCKGETENMTGERAKLRERARKDRRYAIGVEYEKKKQSINGERAKWRERRESGK